MAQLAGRVSIVTGGAQGIGRAIALELARAGADIVLGDIQQDRAEQTAEEIRALGRTALALRLDVSDPASAAAIVEAAAEKFGKVDHLVNNAGITRDNLLMRMKPEDWAAVINVNLTGVFNCTQAVIRTMMKQRYGRIVNISSVIGQMGNAGQANYGASKAGVIGFTKSIAREIGSRGVTVNAITPGFIETAMTGVLAEDVRAAMLAAIPLGRMGTPEDIAQAVRFLVSDDAAYITGAVINVNGGMYM
jgi:3-oxoacyl-[acyl-carrier protein] reductase